MYTVRRFKRNDRTQIKLTVSAIQAPLHIIPFRKIFHHSVLIKGFIGKNDASGSKINEERESDTGVSG